MPERRQINFRLSRENKAKWEGYAEEHPEVSSLSHLIRLSVEREMHGAHQSEEQDLDLTPLEERLQSLENKLDATRDDIGALEATVKHEEGASELEGAVFGLLPAANGPEDFRRKQEGMLELPLEERIAWTGRVDDLSTWFNVSNDTILQKLADLVKNTRSIKTVDVDGEHRFYREVE